MDVQELRKEAQEKLSLTDQQADAFVEGFVKEAAFATGIGPAVGGGSNDKERSGFMRSIGDNVTSSIAGNIGKGLGSLAVNGLVAGVAGIVHSANNSMLYRKFTEALKTVVESNRIVRNADRSKVMSYAETIYKFAPHVASDVNLLSQVLANAIHGEGVDPSTIETITRLEERYSRPSGFQPKTLT